MCIRDRDKLETIFNDMQKDRLSYGQETDLDVYKRQCFNNA